MKKLLYVLFVAASFFIVASCDKNNGVDNTEYGPLSVSGVFYNTTSSLEAIDPSEGVRLGTMIRLEGKNFKGIRKIVCNGSPAYINPNLLTETSVVFRIPSYGSNNVATPTGEDCSEEFRDKIIISSNGNDDYVFNFHIMGARPTIVEISHTIPTAGSWVSVSGTNMKGVSALDFYNDLDVSVVQIGADEIRNNAADGSSFEFRMPEVPEDYEGGYIVITSDNGKAASPNYFYRSKLIFLSKFYSEADDGLYARNPYAANTTYYAWGSGTTGNLPDAATYPDIFANDTDPFPLEGDGPKNPAIFRAMPVPGTAVPVLALNDGEHSADGGSCVGRACFNSDACAGRSLGLAQSLDIGVELFNEASAMEKLAFQFDYYIPVTWDSGRISVTYVDNGIKWMANYHPWTSDPAPFAGGMKGWRTATIPMSDFPNFAGQTYNYIFKNAIKGTNGDYATQGFIAFYNDECDGKAAHAYDNFVLYWNNLRVVPMVTPEIGDE